MKHIFVSFATFLFFAALILASCDGVAYEHTYSTEWMKDDTHHWHTAICGHTYQIKDKSTHDFDSDGRCAVCGCYKDKLPGEFSVGATSKVRFTRGNLFWNGSVFGMEMNQYDYRTWSGLAAVSNGMMTITSAENVGLFYWSRIVERTYAQDLIDIGDATTDTFALANTTEHEAVIDGCDVLTIDEWLYLVGTSAVRSGKYGYATITRIDRSASITGLVLLPDEWSLPTGCSFTAGYDNYFDTNIYSAFDWSKMEQAGAVFLPATGFRRGTEVLTIGTRGDYWSASPDANETYGAYNICFFYHAMNTGSNRPCGRAVRLVTRV